jgi:hypothetical protein
MDCAVGEGIRAKAVEGEDAQENCKRYHFSGCCILQLLDFSRFHERMGSGKEYVA